MTAGAGIVIAVMGLAGAAGRAADAGPGLRLVARVPDPLIALGLVSATFTVLLVLWALLPRGIRRRKKHDEEYELYHELPRISPWIMVVLWILVLLPFAATGYLLWRSWASGETGALRFPHAPLSGWRSLSPIAGEPGTVSPTLWNAGVTALVLGASLGSLTLVLWILFGDRLAWWLASPLPERRSRMLADAVDQGLEDLAREPDARVAVIKCYRRFEQVLGRSRVPRAPWQTPMEFMREALGKLPLPTPAVQRLTELFELARFSNDTLGPAQRASALASLVEIRARLEQETVGAPVD